ncbi:hypothetical protein E2P81_ATG05191 [Venturia nashicola]|nr:hypothetical protein E2P81_ATG05191 [Venturia nashicola]
MIFTRPSSDQDIYAGAIPFPLSPPPPPPPPPPVLPLPRNMCLNAAISQLKSYTDTFSGTNQALEANEANL